MNVKTIITTLKLFRIQYSSWKFQKYKFESSAYFVIYLFIRVFEKEIRISDLPSEKRGQLGKCVKYGRSYRMEKRSTKDPYYPAALKDRSRPRR